MFNQTLSLLKKLSYLLLIALVVTACNEDVKLTFETQQIDKSADAVIAITYPKAIGTKAVAEKINQKIEHVIANEMNMAETTENNMSITDAVSEFDNEYKTFKNDFQDSSQKWEVKVDGKVLYESAEVISISLHSYIDTGGAHGNSRLTYLNFNPETGALLEEDEIISNPSKFKAVAEKAFKEQTKPENADETIEDFFFGEDFQLPANMGFSKEGLILLYNNYEIAAYTQGATKIILPYETVKGVLHINP